MPKKKPIIALMYDFDKTLCTKDMQEYSFIPEVNMSPKEFWSESTSLSKDFKMDRILAYMYLMIQKCNANNKPIKRENFVGLGSNIEFFEGVIDWFDRVNELAKENEVDIEHYIISSGLKEIIEGSQIAKHFKEIYACEFYYNQNGVASWPKLTVNYTNKTQFLFRINKGVLDISDDDSLNKYTPEDERRIPFRNMIYIGDGLTDVPCMKLVKSYGGQSIAVYQKNTKKSVEDLMRDNRVDFIVPADYKKNSELEKIVSDIIKKIAITDKLVALHKKQNAKLL